MNRLAIAIAILGMLISPMIGARDKATAHVTIAWEITLDAQGKVTEIATHDKGIANLNARLENAIRNWQFSAGKVDGRSVPTKTTLQTELEITNDGSVIGVKALKAFVGAGYDSVRAPAYPHLSEIQGEQGLVVLLVNFDAQGKVLGVSTYEDAPHPNPRLQRAAAAGVSEWTFKPELLDGQGIAGRAIVPVCFSIGGHRPPNCTWKSAVAGEKADASHLIALDPAAKLETDVTGRAL